MTPRRVVIVAFFALLGFGAPLAAQPPGEDVLSVSRRIDAAILKRAKADGIAVSGPAEDATFLRRLSLDLTGKIPELTLARDFLDNDDPHKRTAAVERFLGDPRFARHFSSRAEEMSPFAVGSPYQIKSSGTHSIGGKLLDRPGELFRDG